MQSVESVGNVPVMQNERGDTRLIDIAYLKLGTMPGLIERYNGQHVVSMTANLHGITLGEAAKKINASLSTIGDPPKASALKCAADSAFRANSIRLAHWFAAGSAGDFLLLAANFQSVRLALAIVLTIPAVLCGVLLMLLVTGTTLNVQSFMGAIMAIGIAVANSILLVTFAERARHEGRGYLEAAQEVHRPDARHFDDCRGHDLRYAAHGHRIR